MDKIFKNLEEKNFFGLLNELEDVVNNAFIKYSESFKWYSIRFRFPFTDEIFIVTKDCCKDEKKCKKRKKEILEYLKSKKLI